MRDGCSYVLQNYVRLSVYDCVPNRHLQESPDPSGKKSQKSQKIHEKISKYPKKSESGIFFLKISGIFETFLQTPKRPFLIFFFTISGPEGPETPVNGSSGCKCTTFLCLVADNLHSKQFHNNDIRHSGHGFVFVHEHSKVQLCLRIGANTGSMERKSISVKCNWFL